MALSEAKQYNLKHLLSLSDLEHVTLQKNVTFIYTIATIVYINKSGCVNYS